MFYLIEPRFQLIVCVLKKHFVSSSREVKTSSSSQLDKDPNSLALRTWKTFEDGTAACSSDIEITRL